MGLLGEALEQRSPFEAASAEQTEEWPGGTGVVPDLPGGDSMEALPGEVWDPLRVLVTPGTKQKPL